ncbi:VOC family protein [Saccharopolyspora griseoalba]|uniref:VOC family protein n=1 Tax=Saccharopolyspora griseoalba TaxID=1431848 RepID=A0ABW2LLW0_9PSEU
MPAPNMFIVHVADAAKSARFYGELFEMQPCFESPRFIAFELGGGVQLALWSGASGEARPSRTSEVCLCLSGGAEEIDRYHRDWANKGVEVVQEPHDDVFGRTFVVADPDGNLVRVVPVD